MTAFRWIEASSGEVVADRKRLEAVGAWPAAGRKRPRLSCCTRGSAASRSGATFRLGWQPQRVGGLRLLARRYGRSDPVALPRPLDYMTLEARFSLPTVLEAIRFKRGILLGHSDGASIAAIYAGEPCAERLDGLVLIAPHVFAEEPGLASIAEARRAYAEGELRVRLAKHHVHVDCAFRGWNGAWLDPAFRAWNIEDAVRRWRVPALLIQGADDPYGTLAQIRAVEARSPAPVESLILDRCRHAPQTEQPQATLDAIVGFCGEIEARRN